MVWLLASGILVLSTEHNDGHMDGDGDKGIKYRLKVGHPENNYNFE